MFPPTLVLLHTSQAACPPYPEQSPPSDGSIDGGQVLARPQPNVPKVHPLLHQGDGPHVKVLHKERHMK